MELTVQIININFPFFQFIHELLFELFALAEAQFIIGADK